MHTIQETADTSDTTDHAKPFHLWT